MQASKAIGFSMTQQTGESGRATQDGERTNLSAMDEKGNDKWPHFSVFRGFFGQCARFDASLISESMDAAGASRGALPVSGVHKALQVTLKSVLGGMP